MSEDTKIEWCDSTFNPWSGCTKVGPGCDHCYAESLSKRAPKTLGQWGAGAPRRRTSEAYWRQPLRWNARADAFRECAACGWRGDLALRDDPVAFACPSCDATDWRPARRRVFCASLADVFDNEVPAAWRVDLLRLIEATPNLDWLLLTKRIGNVERMLDEGAALMPEVMRWPLPNVWLGATICNQDELDRDIEKLYRVPAYVRFLSIEPMLSAIDFSAWPIYGPDREPLLHWVIAGGESGHGARPAHPDWFRSLRDQCAAAGVPFLHKQNGEFAEATPSNADAARQHRFLEIDGTDSTHWTIDRHSVSTANLVLVGKKAAGRLLDGVEHNGFPNARALAALGGES